MKSLTYCWRFRTFDYRARVGDIGEDFVDFANETSVINKPAAVFALIPTKKSKNFTLVQLNLKSA